MATGSPPDVAQVVVDLASGRPATCGGTRVICVDGPAGSGKTTLSEALVALTGAQVVHADDLMEGWRGLDAVGRQLTSLLADLAAGRTASYQRFDWLHGRYAERPVVVAPGPWLVLEGVGSGDPAISTWVTVLVWVEVEADLRLSRGVERDGEQLADHWRQFMLDEAEVFARDRTRERADVLVDGTGQRPPVVRG